MNYCYVLDDEDNLDDEEVDEEELGLEAVYKDNLDVSHLIFFRKKTMASAICPVNSVSSVRPSTSQ